MNAIVEIITGLMLISGAAFALAASIGLIRLKDVYMRTHAASKAGTLGSGVMLLALAVDAGTLGVVTRAVAGVVFFLLTAPVSAHLLAKAAYAAGYRPCADTKIDALAKTMRPKS
ncbi:MAG: monovalent cation/H(+) antiporter subunit G [Roseibium sp.]|uniref:monovalent cation/H(+) antiporter subunit G n=1 Tax=Roseibium sp. TaxID=1936156 RepID=UPI001B0549CE|nr:monovalent cation/H(+) antiporter subunit G [Roseibium sp.]MBO6893629.1 monovalent cation/H(+) antiporter subunit G [Roseibium sp.]MBO6928124.1 monovalent cation/H(+) antiporter subunit G [Roseibium sp.]